MGTTSTARAFLLGALVALAAGLPLVGCSKFGSEVKNDPLMSAKDTPKDIYMAARTGDLARARELIEAGDWDSSAMDGRAMRPLDCAIEGGNAEIVRLMVENGADMNAHGPKGTSLEYAKKAGKKDVEKVLVELGAQQ